MQKMVRPQFQSLAYFKSLAVRYPSYKGMRRGGSEGLSSLSKRPPQLSRDLSLHWRHATTMERLETHAIFNFTNGFVWNSKLGLMFDLRLGYVETSGYSVEGYFELHIAKDQEMLFIRFPSGEVFEVWLECMSKYLVFTDIDDKYQFVAEKTDGKFQEKYITLLSRYSDTQETFSAKMVSKGSQNSHSATLKELEALWTLASRESIPDLVEIQETDECIIFVMKQLPELPLHQWLSHNESNICKAQVESIILGMLTAARAFKYAGIVHRDINPSNVLVEETPSQQNRFRVCIINYGHSGFESSLSHDKEIVGKYGYIPPEILDYKGGSTYSHEGDVFALGCIIFLLLTRTLPFTGSSFQEIAKATIKGLGIESVRLLQSHDLELQQIVFSMLSLDRFSRPSAEECFHHYFSKGKLSEQHLCALQTSATIDQDKAGSLSKVISRSLRRNANRTTEEEGISPHSLKTVTTPQTAKLSNRLTISTSATVAIKLQGPSKEGTLHPLTDIEHDNEEPFEIPTLPLPSQPNTKMIHQIHLKYGPQNKNNPS
jgi:serine/threonine protein kinase